MWGSLQYERKPSGLAKPEGFTFGVKRLAAAEEAVRLGETLGFLIRCHKEPLAAAEALQQKEARVEKKRYKAVSVEEFEFCAENELRKAKKEGVELIVQKRQNIPVQPSDTGSAMVKLQENCPIRPGR